MQVWINLLHLKHMTKCKYKGLTGRGGRINPNIAIFDTRVGIGIGSIHLQWDQYLVSVPPLRSVVAPLSIKLPMRSSANAAPFWFCIAHSAQSPAALCCPPVTWLSDAKSSSQRYTCSADNWCNHQLRQRQSWGHSGVIFYFVYFECIKCTKIQ